MSTEKVRLVTYIKQIDANKLKKIAENEHRTISREIEHMISQRIQTYEYTNGEIKIEGE